MFKPLKAITTMSAVTVALLAAAPASAETFPERIWTPALMEAMDKNKDGMVSRQEFMDYMGTQFDVMDAKKKGMLNKVEFSDKKMMQSTFPNIPVITAGG